MADALTAALLKEADAFSGSKGPMMGREQLNATAAAMTAQGGNTNLAGDSQRVLKQETQGGAIPSSRVLSAVPDDPITASLLKEAQPVPKGAATQPKAATPAPKAPEAGYEEPSFTPSDLLSAASKGPAGLMELAVKYRKPLAEIGKNVTTSMGGQILGGLAGIYKLATGEGGEKAQEAIEGTQEALTYQPRGEMAKNGVELLGSNANPMNWIPNAADKVGDVGVKSGVLDPAEATVLSTAARFVAPGAALKVVGKGATALRDIGKAGGEAAPFGSVGSAAATNASSAQAAAAAATPELRQAISAGVKDGGKVHAEALKRQVEADSLDDPIRLTGPQARGDVVEISNEFNAQGKNPAISQRFNEQEKKLKNNINLIRDEAAPDVFGTNHVENGQSLIDSYKKTGETIRADVTKKYEELEAANGGNFPIDGIAFVDAAEAALAKKMKGRYVPKEIKADMDAIRESGTMTFEQFENMRTNLAADMRKAERSGDGNTAHAASIVRGALEDLPLTGEAAKLKPLADKARAASKAYHDLLENDPAFKAAVDDSISADKFINKFIINGSAADVKQMADHLGRGSVAHQTMSAGAINFLKEKAGIQGVDNGGFSQNGYNKALDQLRPKLLDIVNPETAKKLDTLGSVARYTQDLRRGNTANVSKTTIAAEATEHAKSLAEHAANAKTIIPFATMGRKFLQKRAEEKSINEALQTGAGIFIRDVGKK